MHYKLWNTCSSKHLGLTGQSIRQRCLLESAHRVTPNLYSYCVNANVPEKFSSSPPDKVVRATFQESRCRLQNTLSDLGFSRRWYPRRDTDASLRYTEKLWYMLPLGRVACAACAFHWDSGRQVPTIMISLFQACCFVSPALFHRGSGRQ